MTNVPKSLMFLAAAGALGAAMPVEAQTYNPQATSAAPSRNTSTEVRLYVLDGSGNVLGELRNLTSNGSDPRDAFYRKNNGGMASTDIDHPAMRYFQERMINEFAKLGPVTQLQQQAIAQQIEAQFQEVIERIKLNVPAAIMMEGVGPQGSISVAAIVRNSQMAGGAMGNRNVISAVKDLGVRVQPAAAPPQVATTINSDVQSHPAALAIGEGIAKQCGLDPNLAGVFAQAAFNDLTKNAAAFGQNPKNYTYNFRVPKLNIQGDVQMPILMEDGVFTPTYKQNGDVRMTVTCAGMQP